MEDNIKPKDDSNVNNPPEPENIQKSDECLNVHKEEEEQNESQKEKDINKDTPKDLDNKSVKENLNSTSNNEKNKRHRRGKNETSAERTFKCPDCEKCYLSGPALIIHRKTKHGYNTETEKKSRGRPKKEELQESVYQNTRVKYNNFLNNSTRKKNAENETPAEADDINLELIKDNLNNIFRQCKNELLFSNLENIENYKFYSLIIKYWEKDNKDLTKDFFDSNNNSGNGINANKCNSPPLDLILLLYLKELATKTNKQYFWFVNKFVVLLREYINAFKKDEVKEEQKTEEKQEYSQLCSAEGIPESFNDFFLEFMQPNKYYGLNEQELIELAQHFCFWLYLNKYTHSYLTLI